MVRSKDLDIIAPDDPIVDSSTVEKTPEIKVAPTSASSDKPKAFADMPSFRQKIYDILGHTHSSLSSFIVEPKVFDFPERENDEEIFLAIRPHWATNFSWIIATIGMVLVPLILNYLKVLDFLPLKYQTVTLLFWCIVTFMFAFEKFLHWYFNVFIITNERLVDIDFNNMLNKHFAEADIDMIQDVSSSVRGILGTFFNFGDVLVQTASEIDEITFEDVPNPEKIIKVLQELRDATEEEHFKGHQK
jgi:hypothetical protein